MQLHVVTPTGTPTEIEVDEVTLPGISGEFGVLKGHIPFVSALQPGVLRYRQGTSKERLAIGAGFAEVAPLDASTPTGKVIVLTESAVKAADVDMAAAKKQLDLAQQELKNAKTGPGRSEIENRIKWAQAQINLRSEP